MTEEQRRRALAALDSLAASHGEPTGVTRLEDVALRVLRESAKQQALETTA
jgi:hypothetical protein